MKDSLVQGSIAAARRSIIACFVATFAAVGAMLAERVSFENTIVYGTKQWNAATAVAGKLLHEDEVLTMSANMAAATGEHRWIERYETHIPGIDAAIGDGLKLASPQVAQRFGRDTKVANDRLVEMERKSFDAVSAGNLATAKSILDSAEYQAQKTVLANGTSQFLLSLKSSAEDNVSQIKSRSMAVLAFLLAFGLVGFTWLWRVLNTSLTTSNDAFQNSEKRLRVMATTDELTGLPNRRTFSEQLQGLIASYQQASSGLIGVAMLDIDHFKDINDTLGHQAGDDVIRLTIERLKACLPPEAVISRFGGDELAVALPVQGRSYLQKRVNVITRAFAKPFSVTGQSIQVSLSGGISYFPRDARDSNELLRLADIALYRAKGDGRGLAREFFPAMDEQVRKRRMLEADLRWAIGKNQIYLEYQPLMSMSGEKVTGLEALVRWQHPERGYVPPKDFIPMAEQTGAIIPLGEWIMRRAFEDAARWPDLAVAVNLSPAQIKHQGFLAMVERLVKETRVKPTQIEFEVTESLVLEASDRVRRAIAGLKTMGFKIALDDFGSGYSSLSYLRRFPFDKLKIDRSFIKGIETSVEAAQIMHSLVNLGRAMQMTVTAEGVESDAQHRFLWAAGCHQLQGFWFSKPLIADDVDKLLGTAPAQATIA